MIAKERIEQLVGEKLTSEMFIVEINVGAGNAISVTVDSFSGLSIDKCVEISRHIEHNLDRETEDFSLEVSSPGLTHPYKVLNQYKKNIGQEVEVVTRDGEKISGILMQAGEDGFTIEAKVKTKVNGKKLDETKPVSFSFEQIKTVKSVITFK